MVILHIPDSAINASNTSSQNESGIITLPGGYRYATGIFTDIIISCSFWSSTMVDEALSRTKSIEYNDS